MSSNTYDRYGIGNIPGVSLPLVASGSAVETGYVSNYVQQRIEEMTRSERLRELYCLRELTRQTREEEEQRRQLIIREQMIREQRERRLREEEAEQASRPEGTGLRHGIPVLPRREQPYRYDENLTVSSDFRLRVDSNYGSPAHLQSPGNPTLHVSFEIHSHARFDSLEEIPENLLSCYANVLVELEELEKQTPMGQQKTVLGNLLVVIRHLLPAGVWDNGEAHNHTS